MHHISVQTICHSGKILNYTRSLPLVKLIMCFVYTYNYVSLIYKCVTLCAIPESSTHCTRLLNYLLIVPLHHSRLFQQVIDWFCLVVWMIPEMLEGCIICSMYVSCQSIFAGTQRYLSFRWDRPKTMKCIKNELKCIYFAFFSISE